MNKYLVWLFPVLLALGFVTIACLPVEKAPQPVKSGEIRIITPDWSSAETLVTLGAPLVGVSEKPSYNVWVGEPKIPDSIIDMGLRAQPSYDLVDSLQPTQLVNSAFLQKFLPSIFSSIPFKQVNFITDKGGSWDQIVTSTHDLAEISGHPDRGEQLIQDTEQLLDKHSQQLSAYANRPIAIVQFIDARSLRIFGNSSLYGIVLNKLKLHNAWTKTSSIWGFDTIPLSGLVSLPKDTVLLIVKPNPVTVSKQLSRSAIWQHLPMSAPENYRVMPSTWLFGGLPAVQHFSTTVVDALIHNKEVSW